MNPVFCEHLVNCHLNCVRNALNRNSAVCVQVLEGSGIDYVHWWRFRNVSFLVLNLRHNKVIIVKAACHKFSDMIIHPPSKFQNFLPPNAAPPPHNISRNMHHLTSPMLARMLHEQAVAFAMKCWPVTLFFPTLSVCCNPDNSCGI
jgi:hypothetical protein